MRDLFIVFAISVGAIVLGTLLFFYGGNRFNSTSLKHTDVEVGFVLMQEGLTAFAVDTATNYRITNNAELAELWSFVYGNSGPVVPTVDFEKKEVLAIFDGSHSTQGYAVSIRDITDVDGKRMVTVLHHIPSEKCLTPGSPSSPFQIVLVPKTDLALTHADEIVTEACN
jgi:hypothetical protein